MRVPFWTRSLFPATYNPLWFALYPIFNQRFNLSQTLILEMGTKVPAKRPFCRSCSKPARLCLCARIRTPLLDNSISVTILQHNQERNHPLNSTRIATLGLKNLTLATVSDVHFEAQFLIRMLEPGPKTSGVSTEAKSSLCSSQNHSEKLAGDRILESQVSQKPVSEVEIKSSVVGSNMRNGYVGCLTHLEGSQNNEEKTGFQRILGHPAENKTAMNTTNVECGLTGDLSGLQSLRNCSENTDALRIPALSTRNDSVLEIEHESTIKENNGKCGSVNLEISQSQRQKQHNFDIVSAMHTVEETVSNTRASVWKPDLDQIEATPTGEEEPVITATIAKRGFTCSLTSLLTLQNNFEKLDFDQLLASPLGQDVISNGFMVKKLQRKQLNASMEFEEYEEFEIEIPPGSALLFPTKKSIGIEAVDFEVKHLIVLDGTWGKAKRMYHENPWMKLLPHLKLDSNKMSLYSEVRHQPKVGCLSTIESIVSAMKALGDDNEGLDNLLDVFESMVRDQRQCKDEKLSEVSPA